MRLRSIKSVKSWKGKGVLLRIDGNVPVVHGRAVDGSHGRLAQSVETIRYLAERGAEVIVMTHLGRPKPGQRMSVAPIASRLRALLGKKMFSHVRLLDNLRHNPGEEKNDLAFAKELAKLADVYVNDAFGVSHRAHASVSAIQKLLPSYAGLLLVREVEVLEAVRQKPSHPFVLVIGGAKLETKMGLLKKLGTKADAICLGGALANTFLAAMGVSMGDSLYEPKEIPVAKQLFKKFGKKMHLPMDFRLHGAAIEDLGPATIKAYTAIIKQARTIVWNGPFGRVEDKRFAVGTQKIAQAIAESRRATTIVGGGDTVPLLEKWGLAGQYTHVSTGGGAMLAFLAGEKLPGVTPLIKKR